MLFDVENRILPDVRKVLDENEIAAALITVADNDTLTVNDIIRSKIEDSARGVLAVAPNILLDEGQEFPDKTITWEKSHGIGSGWVSLPADFLRLVRFKMSDWVVPVLMPISDADPAYALQKSKYAGVRGNTHKPVCAITSKGGERILEFFSCQGGKSVTLDEARYYAYPQISANTSLEFPVKLYPALKYHIASLVAMTFKDTDHAATLMTQATDLLK